MIIDGKDLILGKLAAFAAKKALEGEVIDIVNVEQIVISGSKQNILKKYSHRRERGNPHHGPHFPKNPELIVKRAVRGMLPYKQERGKTAFKKIKCFKGIPLLFKDKKLESIKGIDVKNLNTLKYITVGELSKLLGAK